MNTHAAHVNLRHNGAEDPDRWRASHATIGEVGPTGAPVAGDVMAWRYAAWRVTESVMIPEDELSDEERDALHKIVNRYTEEYRPRRYTLHRPKKLVVRYESGPLLLDGIRHRTLDDGTPTLHFRVGVGDNYKWQILSQPWLTCSCHGHIWPCQEMDRARLAAYKAEQMDRLMAATAPGVCAHCLEPISSRQKMVSFPEPSRTVPGAPGPSYHAGRTHCWHAAAEYELTGRLADNPEVTRVASCPGTRFIHEQHGLLGAQRIDCNAGPGCTDLHGPPGYRADVLCWQKPEDIGRPAGAPTFDCGYRSSFGDCRGKTT